ncbi:hypothetical protein SIAM614_24677 [Stappia aggregata IAM 12614]|uniref:Uncharacterized protein n=1 Tax=Roseibium aggregatum (strain ATCC 25650 / DSM 13394 / JCM 20685 / NBRC 16684 / NCIMB 2208 / IAM 12614 / B1) TaxID=384765 RepID=A0NNZ2_ROSAI|nr:hypothetical protein SIAM614_24677 [Stappia aggregata IAM 12614] [Roseibium aggregatum IAM 12614]
MTMTKASLFKGLAFFVKFRQVAADFNRRTNVHAHHSG